MSSGDAGTTGEGRGGDGTASRVAACACGALKAKAAGEPLLVYACSCLECQRASGSVFTYLATYRARDVAIEGEYRSWRRGSQAGRWVESCFCPACGTPLFGRAEADPGTIQISAGCFADPGFPPPSRLFWAARRHRWLPLPAGTAEVERQ